jgi:Cd2+/Zn2+-exporting ATPase
VPEGVESTVADLQANAHSVLVVRRGQQWLGVIGVADPIRPGVQRLLGQLRELGIRSIVMLTGDNRPAAEAIARQAGIDRVCADLLPEDKVVAVKDLLAVHGRVAMVGDGVNDAPALAHASVGIAMGGAGTAVAMETADVVLMGDDIGKLPFLVGLSRQAGAVIQQNLVVSLAVVAGLVATTITGVAGIGWAVLVHEGSTLLVIANSLRLLAYGNTRHNTTWFGES